MARLDRPGSNTPIPVGASATGWKLVWRGQLVRQVVAKAADEGAKASAEAVLLDANYHVPYKKGDLQDSGTVTQGRNALGRFVGEAFVSYDTVYAVRLHENPQFNFTPPGEGKWLEKALKRHQRKMLPTMAEPLIKALRLP